MSRQANFFVNVNLKTMSFQSNNDRIPMDLVCVLDNSGSMTGKKIASVKEAMRFIQSQLMDQDRLAIIEFNSSAKVLQGLKLMSPANKATSEVVVRNISADGGTDIYDGLSKGYDVLESRQTKNKLCSVFLLTDGCDSSRLPDKMALAGLMRAKGMSLFVFGFGADHDCDQLQKIAAAAEGSFSYVEKDDMVVDAFGGSLGGQQALVSRDLEVEVQLRGDCTLVRPLVGRYQHSIGPDRKSIKISFANLFIGEQRDMLLELDVPSAAAPEEQFQLLTATASYLDPNTLLRVSAVTEGGTDLVTADASVRRLDRPRTDASVMDVAVDIQRCRALVTDSLQQAMQAADRGDYGGAKGLLLASTAMVKSSAGRDSAVCASLLDDLNETVAKVENRNEYERCGGKATITENLQNNLTQRNNYSKAGKSRSAYQTDNSVAMQCSAFEYKKKSGFF